MALIGLLIFAGGFAVAAYALATTLAPNLDRIVEALAGRSTVAFAPLEQLVRAENRIAVRRWASSQARRPSRLRAAA